MNVMVKVELGRDGQGGIDTVNIFKAKPCPCPGTPCPYFDNCTRYNGNRVLTFPHGVTSDTVGRVRSEAPCVKS